MTIITDILPYLIKQKICISKMKIWAYQAVTSKSRIRNTRIFRLKILCLESCPAKSDADLRDIYEKDADRTITIMFRTEQIPVFPAHSKEQTLIVGIMSRSEASFNFDFNSKY